MFCEGAGVDACEGAGVGVGGFARGGVEVEIVVAAERPGVPTSITEPNTRVYRASTAVPKGLLTTIVDEKTPGKTIAVVILG